MPRIHPVFIAKSSLAMLATALLSPLVSGQTITPTDSSTRPALPVLAQYADLYHQKVQQAQQKHLAHSRGWLRLLYYPEPSSHSHKVLKSRINNPNFFVSDFVDKGNNIDPQAELSATLTALFSQTSTNTPASQAVACRFPARTHWLMQQLDISPSALPPMNCPELQAWERDFTPIAVSLVFAEEYLSNPASMFGHSFLRFDSAMTGQASILNYMPKTVPNEPFLKSSYKSVIAGNVGEFTLQPYEEKIASYRDQEGRDIWRYPLNLTVAEREQLARLIWEIKDQNLKYLLTKDNCASEILALLNVLRPEQNYLKGYHAIVAPADIVRSLQRQNVITGEPIFEPSKQSQKQAQLNKAVTNHSEPTPAPIHFDNNPLNAQALSRISVGRGQQNHKDFGELGYRLVYHDALDGQNGYPSGFYLEGLSAKVRYFSQPLQNDNKLQLENFTLLKARSLNPINTADKGKSPNMSWGGHLSVERILTPNQDGQTSHLVGSVGAEYGWSVAYGKTSAHSTQIPPNICYALGTGDMQVGKGFAHANRLGIGAVVGCIQQFSPSWRGLAEVKLPYWYESGRDGSNGYWQSVANIGIQHDLTRQDSVRLTGEYQWQPNVRVTNNGVNTSRNTTQTNTPEILLQYLRYF